MLNCRSGVPRSWARNPGSQCKFWHSVSLTLSTVDFIYPWTSGSQVKSLPYPFWKKIRIEWFLSSSANSLGFYDLPTLMKMCSCLSIPGSFPDKPVAPGLPEFSPALQIPRKRDVSLCRWNILAIHILWTVMILDSTGLSSLMPGIHFGEKSPNALRVQLKDSKPSGEGIQRPCSQGADDWCQSPSFGRWKCWQICNFLTSRGTGATNRGQGTRNGWCRPHFAQ